ncbi:WLM domain-containing protein [Lentinula aff. lateritia]|uniref:WLM domain-containing protein n=1 Tax=Lentinula aff. lateritia TaxID=2804960 RepID=A0ACC1UCI8_9AGAR|nr:WLM domain-containing protein [Lentinula aff. lateritia]
MSEVYVQSFTHLKDRKSADKALEMLRRVASLVKPIMRKHSWVLPVLAEFFPDNPNLLVRTKHPCNLGGSLTKPDVNMGHQILVRLRPPHSPDSFLPEEDVVQTMLHELTHNVHGPHDEKFYKFLAELQEEYDALQRSGYAGEGFFSKGNRLGTNISHNIPPHLARAQAVAAAEKRRDLSQTLGGGGRRLGGGTEDRAISVRERAKRAAERRLLDERSCGQGEFAQREADKAAKESVENKVIDLTLDSDEPDVITVHDTSAPGPSKIAVRPPKSVLPSSLPPRTTRAAASSSSSRTGSESKPPPFVNLTTKPLRDRWECPACTLINAPLSLQCEACLATKPSSKLAGWTCLTCGESGMPDEFWSCSFCGTIKAQS